MPALENLDLYDNLINYIADLSRFPKLRQLDLSFNCLQSLDGVGQANGLQELYACNNYVSDLAPLSGLADLRILELGRNKIKVANALLLTFCFRT